MQNSAVLDGKATLDRHKINYNRTTEIRKYFKTSQDFIRHTDTILI